MIMIMMIGYLLSHFITNIYDDWISLISFYVFWLKKID
jgi:hypothetical protein